jgi:cytidylate kinase
MTISAAVLQRQDDRTSDAVVALLRGNAHFRALSEAEGKSIIERDREDETKLAVGIDVAVRKGVLPANIAVDPARKIDVVGKTADAVANEIVSHLPSRTANVIILQGLSGTGKGTTVKKLQSILPRCVCWSNGNVFRTFTHLLSEIVDAQHQPLTAEVFTPEMLQSLSKRLTFEKFDDGFDVVIDGTTRVSRIQNTVLKMPHIGSRVPTVAEQTQGEVVLFAAAAVDALSRDGYNVILEGRAQTLNYIPSPHRFELVIEDPITLGERRAAQRVMARALEMLGATVTSAHDDEVTRTVFEAASAL